MLDLKWIVLGITVVMYLLVIFFQERKIAFTSAAAVLIVALGFVFENQIFKDCGNGVGLLFHVFGELINWNVLMIYVGSMIIASLFIYSKVPSRIADFLVSISPNTGIAVVLILFMTGIISIFVENVATVLVMSPIALALSKKLKLNPVPFIIGLAVMSNLEGTATLVGDPPSMIFASYAGYSFNDFFVKDGRLSIFFIIQAGLVAGCLFFYSIFGRIKEKASVEKTDVVSCFPFALLLVMIFGLMGLSFLHSDLSFLSGSFVLALGIAGLLWYRFFQKKTYGEVAALVKALDWETIFFLTGIFVIVGAVSETGLLDEFASFLSRTTGGNKLAGFVLILLFSILISGFVDNVPYIIVMLPVAATFASNLGISKELYMFALLIGSCLGGNLTPFGASANVVSTGILKGEGHAVSFGGFLKIGLPFTLITTITSSVVLWFLWA